MSFKQNDRNPMVITRDNYEEYLLLYVDDELAPEEKKAVDDFLLLHPDLQAELDVLMGTKLLPEQANFGAKESLLADSMKVNAVEEALLLYVDDELGAAGKAALEARLQKEESLNLQHQLLRRTKLDPQEAVPYPDKKELYRTTKRRIGVPAWMPAAAAVLLIASMGVLYLAEGDESAQPVSVARQTAPAPVPQTKEAKTAKEEAPVEVATGAEQSNSPDKIAAIEAPVERKEEIKESSKVQNSAASVLKKAPAAPVSEDPKTDALIALQPSAHTPLASQKNEAVQQPAYREKDPEPDVTLQPTRPYNSEPSATNTEAVYAAQVVEEDRSRSRLKGLLRKATRFVERRTGIDATNGEDELLIGAVALKLR